MSVYMILQDGPLDGKKQEVQTLPNAPASVLLFNMPNYQSFDTDGTVVSLGLQVTYGFVEEGPPPDVSSGDDWDSSWIYGFLGEAWIPIPPPLPTPGPEPLPVEVSMVAEGFVTMDSDVEPGVEFTDESTLVVAGDVTHVDFATVALSGESVLQVTPDFSPPLVMTATTSMTIMLESADTGYGSGAYGDGPYGG